MLKDLARISSSYGLKLHADKTVVLTNVRDPPKQLSCGGYSVKVAAPSDKHKYLGRVVSMDGFHDAELSNRIACGWSAFMKHKLVLCNRRLLLRKRLRLFDAVVTPTILYGCAAWTLKQHDYQKLQTTRRRMLRWMLGCRRYPDEDWLEHRIRATHLCETLASKQGLKDWGQSQRAVKWKFAGRVARCSDGRWSRRLLEWSPIGQRRVGRPNTRWDDELAVLAGGEWPRVAEDAKTWSLLESGYVSRCYGM